MVRMSKAMAVKSLHLVKCVFTVLYNVIGVIYMYINDKVFVMKL